jgi:hypothetical protein
LFRHIITPLALILRLSGANLRGVFMNDWLKKNIDSTDILAALILAAVVIMSVNGVGGEDLPKVVLGGLIGYLSKRQVGQ